MSRLSPGGPYTGASGSITWTELPYESVYGLAVHDGYLFVGCGIEGADNIFIHASTPMAHLLPHLNGHASLPKAHRPTAESTTTGNISGSTPERLPLPARNRLDTPGPRGRYMGRHQGHILEPFQWNGGVPKGPRSFTPGQLSIGSSGGFSGGEGCWSKPGWPGDRRIYPWRYPALSFSLPWSSICQGTQFLR